jgi:hypothetical protein
VYKFLAWLESETMSRAQRLLTLIVLVFSVVTPALAQTGELQLFVRRNFGYGGGDQIQGSFRMEATGPADLASVTFKVDDQFGPPRASGPVVRRA